MTTKGGNSSSIQVSHGTPPAARAYQHSYESQRHESTGNKRYPLFSCDNTAAANLRNLGSTGLLIKLQLK